MGQGFHVYAAVVKNLRGVIYSSLGPEGFGEKISWLRKRFRYRNLGLTPHIRESYRDVLGRTGRVLIELAEPDPALGELVDFYRDITGLDRPVLEAYCYASVYVSPVLVLGEECADDLSRLVVGEVTSREELSDRDYKLHMRIADYTVLDFYLWSTSGALEALKTLASGGDIRAVLEERRGRVEEDKRRYWRIISEGGRTFLLYLDLLPLLAGMRPGEARGLLERYGWLVPATLAVISAVVI